jgi:hypothetical protein
MTNAGDLMPEGDASTGSSQHRPEHQFWLTMQAAHAQWANATEALDYLFASAPSDSPSPDDRLRIAKAAAEQRVRFEEYIEARLAFSEFQSAQFQAVQLQSARDRAAVAAAAEGEDSQPGFHEIALGPWTLRTTSKLAMAALAIALLGPAVFGLTYVMHARQQVRDLDAARDAMSAQLTQARSQTQIAVQQARAVPPAPERPASTPVPAKHVKTPAAAGRWRRVGTPRPPQKKAVVQAHQTAQRKNLEFTLAPSLSYSRVGPLRVSLHNLDHQHDCFDLSVMMGDFRLDRKRVKRYEAVWINLGGSATPVRFVADRIDRNDVHGYLTTPDPKPTASPARRITSAGAPMTNKNLAE